MRWFYTIFINFIGLYSYSQGTYSKLIDLGLSFNNYITDLEISNEYLYVSGSHLCKDDSINNNLYQCTSISKYNLLANIIDKVLLDSFFPEGLNRLHFSNNTVFLSGHFRGEFSGRPIILLEFSEDLILDSTYEFSSDIEVIPNNEGISESSNSFYLYGTTLNINENKKYSQITKIDTDTKEVSWNNIYSRGDWKNECHDLQETNDGNLVFIQHFNDGPGSGGESGYQIVLLDTSGLVLDSFEFEDIDIDNPRILASKEGDIYFSSQDPPYPHTIPSNGRINKISNDLDNLEWSLELPSNAFIDGHRYKIYDYLQTLNGDIVACGTVWDESPDGPLGTPNDHTWNGFIVRVTQSGEIKWLRIYRHPNNHTALPTKEFGKFRPSLLNKIYETADNNFIVGGTVYYNSQQDTQLPIDENKSLIWLMQVSNAGCLENEECKKTIILNGKNELAPDFKIGTSWTYEVTLYPSPVYTTFVKYTITDTTFINLKRVFVIESHVQLISATF